MESNTLTQLEKSESSENSSTYSNNKTNKIKIHLIKNSPIAIAKDTGDKKNKWVIIIGKDRISKKEFKYIWQAKRDLKRDKWNYIFAMIIKITEQTKK